MTKYIAPLTSILVLIIAVMSFIPLQNLALIAGFPESANFLFPLIIYLTCIVYVLIRISRL